VIEGGREGERERERVGDKKVEVRKILLECRYNNVERPTGF
jgi:hypothetical protein